MNGCCLDLRSREAIIRPGSSSLLFRASVARNGRTHPWGNNPQVPYDLIIGNVNRNLTVERFQRGFSGIELGASNVPLRTQRSPLYALQRLELALGRLLGGASSVFRAILLALLLRVNPFGRCLAFALPVMVLSV